MDINSLQKLSKSPMFQLSLGSKELFHSNFLYWLWKAEPDAFWKIMDLFGIKTSDKNSLVVKREWEHFDLSIVHVKKGNRKIDDVIAVIENKVKSVPREDQLKEYSDKIATIDKNGCKKILMSLIEPDFGKTKGWENYTYERFKDIIKQIVDSSIVSDAYNRSIITDYYNMIEALVTFKKEWIQESFASMQYMDIFDNLSVKDYIELRINDLRHKIIYSKMFSELKEGLGMYGFVTGVGTTKEIFKEGHSLTIGYGMTRATGLIETKVRINDDYLLGIQVQGNQYRHFIEFSSSSNVKELEPRKLQGMFDYGNEFEIHNQKTCSYSNAERKKTFQYVYRIIGKDETIENVVNNIVDDVKYLLERKPHLTLL